MTRRGLDGNRLRSPRCRHRLLPAADVDDREVSSYRAGRMAAAAALAAGAAGAGLRQRGGSRRRRRFPLDIDGCLGARRTGGIGFVVIVPAMSEHDLRSQRQRGSQKQQPHQPETLFARNFHKRRFTTTTPLRASGQRARRRGALLCARRGTRNPSR